MEAMGATEYPGLTSTLNPRPGQARPGPAGPDQRKERFVPLLQQHGRGGAVEPAEERRSRAVTETAGHRIDAITILHRFDFIVGKIRVI